MNINTKLEQIPLLLRNMKKKFGQNIHGPVLQRESEYLITIKSSLLLDILKFLRNRGIERLAAITAWESETEIKIAYHFIAKIGVDYLDSKITIITFLPTTNRAINSIRSIYLNAYIFEDELKEDFQIDFIS